MLKLKKSVLREAAGDGVQKEKMCYNEPQQKPPGGKSGKTGRKGALCHAGLYHPSGGGHSGMRQINTAWSRLVG
ncbi:S-adenosylmethionine synthetase [Clostridium sp. SY8519]|nr:S-adenosylmethionine synthetase [Clostridium sp. SY8519]